MTHPLRPIVPILLEIVLHTSYEVKGTRTKVDLNDLEISGSAEKGQRLRAIGNHMPRGVQPIPVLTEQPEVQTAGVRNCDLNYAVRLENPFNLTKSLFGISEMLEHIVEPNNIKKALWEMDISEFPVLHIQP